MQNLLRLNFLKKQTIPMVQSAPKTLTVDEFITHYGNSDCYELTASVIAVGLSPE